MPLVLLSGNFFPNLTFGNWEFFSKLLGLSKRNMRDFPITSFYFYQHHHYYYCHDFFFGVLVIT